VGHALGGVAAGWIAIPPEARWSHGARAALVVAALGVAPDLDLLINDHRGPFHSLGAAILIGLVTLALTRSVRWSAAASLAWASHVGLDWLGDDNFPPIGIMALWPLSRAFFQSSLHVFPSVSRSYWLAEFWIINLKALIVEICVLGPIAALVLVGTRRRRAGR
jgi:membrane-bound metal-dependent hydrolase YbcI (DUF457 family)